MAYLNPSIVDGVAVAQATRSPKQAADWIEANVEGLTVERFSDGSKAPTIREANAMMNETAAIWARENPIRSSAPDPDATKTEMALRMKN
ncbi:hypothetical protein VZ95_18385, partial [Elstera litoralis]